MTDQCFVLTRPVWVAALLGASLACSGGGAPRAEIVGLEVSPTVTTLVRGDRPVLRARATSRDGSSSFLFSGVEWSITGGGAAVLDASVPGLVHALAGGTAVVTARAGAASAEARVDVLPQRLVFLSSETGSGDLSTWPSAGGASGVRGADAVCQALAARAGRPGTFRAWMSDASDDAYCRIHGLGGNTSFFCGEGSPPATAGPWMQTDGTPFGERIDLLLAGAVYGPLRRDERGVEVPPHTAIWTGTLDDVTLETAFPTTSTCRDWTTADGTCEGWTTDVVVADATRATVGVFHAADDDWTSTDGVGRGRCDLPPARLYCFED